MSHRRSTRVSAQAKAGQVYATVLRMMDEPPRKHRKRQGAEDHNEDGQSHGDVLTHSDLSTLGQAHFGFLSLRVAADRKSVQLRWGESLNSAGDYKLAKDRAQQFVSIAGFNAA